jgi:hypothetical protein
MMVVVVFVCEGGDSFLMLLVRLIAVGWVLFISLVSMQHAQFACFPWAGWSGSDVGLWARPAQYRPVDAVRS